ncbi:MAG: serine/threonine-protein kinase [Myxococcota bacterium]
MSLEEQLSRGRPQPDPIAARVARANVLRRLAGVESGPATLGRFVLLERLGAGAYGSVYAAYDPKLDRRVAVKRLHREPEGPRSPLMREAKALARLSHPNVVNVYEVDETDGYAYVVMELIAGTTLAKWLAARSRSTAQILEVLCGAGRGLAQAHAQGMSHRDFKPGNVMVGDDGRARVTDFGLADRGDEERSPTESTSEASEAPSERTVGLGTPAYMAPEQLRGRAADARSDQFAFCVTLFEALTGRRPFGGETATERLAAIDQGPAPADAEALPRRLREVVLRGLDPEPTRRHPDLTSLIDVLERQLRPRSRGGWIVASMLAVAAGAVGWAQGRDHDECLARAQAIDTTWSAARQASIDAAFSKTGRPYAEHAQAFVHETIDRYAREWSEASVGACRARTSSTAPPTPREVCLERRRAELDALLGEFESADEALVRRSTSAVSALTPVSHCDRPDALADRSTLDADAQARVAELEKELAEVSAHRLAGRYGTARTRLEPLIVRLRALGHDPMLADGLVRLGRLQRLHGEWDAAESTLQDGLQLAVASRADAVAAVGAANLADTRFRRRDPEAAEEAAALALALHRRRTGESTWPHLSNVLGSGLGIAVRYADAVEVLAEGIAAAEADADGNRMALMSMYANHGALLLRLGRMDDAARSIAAAEDLARDLIGDHHPQFAKLMQQRAQLLSHDGDHQGALELQQRALEIWRGAVTDPSPTEDLMMSNLADFLGRLGRYDEALQTLDEILKLEAQMSVESGRNAWMGDTLTKMASIEELRGDPKAALRHCLHALEVRKDEVKAHAPGVGELVQFTAKIMIDLGDDRADAMLARGLEIYRRVEEPRSEGRLLTLRGVHRANRGDDAGARADLTRALPLLAETDPSTHAHAEKVLDELIP